MLIFKSYLYACLPTYFPIYLPTYLPTYVSQLQLGQLIQIISQWRTTLMYHYVKIGAK